MATDDGALTIPGFMIAEKDCPMPEGLIQQEMADVDPLSNAAAYRVDGQMKIDDAAGETILIFTRKRWRVVQSKDTLYCIGQQEFAHFFTQDRQRIKQM